MAKNLKSEFNKQEFYNVATRVINQKDEAIRNARSEELQLKWLKQWGSSQNPTIRVSLQSPGGPWRNINEVCNMINESCCGYVKWRRDITSRLNQAIGTRDIHYRASEQALYLDMRFPAITVEVCITQEDHELDIKIESLSCEDIEISPEHDKDYIRDLQELRTSLLDLEGLFQEIIFAEKRWRDFNCSLFYDKIPNIYASFSSFGNNVDKNFFPIFFPISAITQFDKHGHRLGIFTIRFTKDMPEINYHIYYSSEQEPEYDKNEITYIKQHIFVKIGGIYLFEPPV